MKKKMVVRCWALKWSNSPVWPALDPWPNFSKRAVAALATFNGTLSPNAKVVRVEIREL